ncbi:MAG: glycosyltransferase family 2 protein [Candidatus Bathyarchaeia archaeon]
MKCFVVLPCYNEEDNIEPLVCTLNNAFSPHMSYEIVAVNDGSRDSTRALLKESSKKYPIHMLEHETNKGLAAALKTGLGYAIQFSKDEDLVFTMDADNTHNPQFIIDMINASKHADIVIGSRYVEKGRQLNVPFYRVMLSKTVNFLIAKVMKLPAKDATSGYRCFKASTLQKLDLISKHNLIESRGFEASLEILAKAYWCDSTIKEVPITLDYGKKRSRSKMRLFPTIRRYVALLVKSRSWASTFRNRYLNQTFENAQRR